jgi:hypothetical protein
MSSKLTRRRALKMAAASSTAIASTSLTAANKNRGVDEFRGLSYDVYTHQAQGEASAELEETEDGLKGSLSVGGFDIPIETTSGEPVSPDRADVQYPEYSLSKPEFSKNGDPLLCVLTKLDDGSAHGYLARRDSDTGRLAFTVGNPDHGLGVDAIRRSLVGDGVGNPDRIKKDMPGEGLPEMHRPWTGGEGR